MSTSTPQYLNTQPGSLDSEFSGRQDLRNMENDGVSALAPLPPTHEEVYIAIPTRDPTWQSTCKVTRPKSPSSTPRPLIVMIHAGAFRRGSPEMYTRPAREYALHLDAVVVSIEYRLAPESPWPTAVLDAWDVCDYLTNTPSERADEIFGVGTVVDSTGFVVVGASSGANIAAAVVTMNLLQGRGQLKGDERFESAAPLKVPVRGVYLGVPFLVVDREALGEGVYTSHAIDGEQVASYDQVVREYGADVRSPMTCPLNVAGEVLAMWPPTCVQVGGKDVLRDDGVVFEAALKKNGVQTKLYHYPELAHTTWSVYTTGPEWDIGSELGRDTMEAMKWLLGRD